MKHVTVRQLTKEDIGFAHEMTVREQWNDRLEDIERMFTFEPNGCLMAEVDGKPAGHVFAISYGKLGWTGLLIVKVECRRIGIGRLLMIKAKDYLLSQGVTTIKLEAVPAISDLYRSIGFADEYDSLRFMGTVEGISSTQSSSAIHVKRQDLNEVAKFDAEYFGADRTRVLIRLYQEYPQFCFVSYAG
jgi:GNAT superfamily N-acetyltransferase